MAEPYPVLIPRETVNDESVRVLLWNFQDGDAVAEGDLLGEVETSKVAMELHAPVAGFIRLAAKVGEEMPVGAAVCWICERAGDSTGIGQHLTSSQAPHACSVGRPDLALKHPWPDLPRILNPVRFTPLAKRLADAHGFTLSDFSGLRIVRMQDVKARIAVCNGEGSSVPAPVTAPGGSSVGPQAELQVSAFNVDIRWEELPRRKLAEACQIRTGMLKVLPSSVTVCSPTKGLREAIAEAHISGVTSSAIIISEVARLLKKYRLLNAIYENGKVGYYERVNIGWALDDGSGLIVPVIQNADRKSLLEIAAETKHLLGQYLEKQLATADLVGATFTISDLSTEQGVFQFSPLISQGQSAILGVGAPFFVPDSRIGIFNLTLAFDHQLVDGRIATKFLQDLVHRLAGYEGFSDLQTLTGVGEKPQPICSFCSRSEDVLKEIPNWYLVRCEVPPGFVCSHCLAGY